MESTSLRAIIVIAIAVLIVGGMFVWGRYMDAHSDEPEEGTPEGENKDGKE